MFQFCKSGDFGRKVAGEIFLIKVDGDDTVVVALDATPTAVAGGILG